MRSQVDRNARRRARNPDSDSFELDPVLDFMRLLWSVEHGLQSTSKRMKAVLGITGPQRLALRIVSERAELLPSELARILHLHPSTITGILQRLVRKRLIQAVRDRADGRRVRLRLRPGARSFVAASPETVEAAVARVLSHMPAQSIRHARRVLAAIATALTDDRDRREPSPRARGGRVRAARVRSPRATHARR
jgi:DNA-binding MarR family transcriptional regulator